MTFLTLDQYPQRLSIKNCKVEKQHVQITFGIYCKLLTKNDIHKEKKKFVLIPKASLSREITEPFRQINVLGENVLY